MSMVLIRAALEQHLAALVPDLPTAVENTKFTPPTNGGPYQEAHVLPADPITPMDTLSFIEQGIFQVTLCYPLGAGSRDAADRAEAVRSHFARGTPLTAGGISVTITSVPSVAKGDPENGYWKVPVTIRWQAQVSS